MGRPHIDITGQRFGRLVAREIVAQTLAKQMMWRCNCDCGGEHIAVQSKMRSGEIRSCGCLVGDVRRLRDMSVDVRARFPTFFEKTDGCWEWQGALRNGYGVIGIGGKKIEYAHRLAYFWHYGPLPEGQEVCHHCDNRKCVRPEHLFGGTRSDNMQDASQKGRIRTPNRWRPGTFHQDEPV